MLAFVLGGGSSRGALQVGAMKALIERGIFPDMMVGCSIGAINSIALAEDPSAEMLNRLESLYLETDFGDVFTGGPEVLANLFDDGIYSNDGLQEILENQLAARRFSDLSIPCYTIATDLESGEAVVFGANPNDSVIDGALASAALLPLYKPHEVNGRTYGDGGMNSTLPIEVAIEHGAKTIVAFNIMAQFMPAEMRNTPQNMFLHSIDLLVNSQIQLMVHKVQIPEDVTLYVIDLKSADYVPMYEMNKMAEMIESGHRCAEEAFANELSDFVEEHATRQTFENKGYVILNPVSGAGDPSLIREPLVKYLGEERYNVYETTEDDSPTEIAKQAVENGYRWVAAAGGDGTVSAVADGLAGTDIPLVVIPAGTANGIAQGLGVPNDIDAACQLIASSDARIKSLDAIKVGERYYLLQMGVGIEAATMQNTPRGLKQIAGATAYLATAVREAIGWEQHQFTLKLDGETHQIEAAEIVIANLADIGVLDLQWNEEIQPDDGVIDIAIVRAEGVLDYAKVVTQLVRGKPELSEHIQFLKAEKEIELSADSDLPLHGDGELIEDGLPLKAEVAPAVLRVLVPSKQPN